MNINYLQSALCDFRLAVTLLPQCIFTGCCTLSAPSFNCQVQLLHWIWLCVFVCNHCCRHPDACSSNYVCQI